MIKRWGSVTISNFQAIRRVRYEVADITFLLGRNEAGKSSSCDAIFWCLTGRGRGLDGGGRGASKLVHDGTKGAGVEIEGRDFQGVPWTFGRYAAATGSTRMLFWPGVWRSVDGDAPSLEGDEAAAGLAGVLGVSGDVLAAGLNGAKLLQGDHAEQKTILLRMLNVAVKDDEAGRVYTLDELDAAEEAARQERKELKRTIAEFGNPEPPAVRAFSSIEVLEGRVATAREALEGEVARTSEASGRLRALQDERSGLLRRIVPYAGNVSIEGATMAVEKIAGLVEASMDRIDELSALLVDRPSLEEVEAEAKAVDGLRVEVSTQTAVSLRLQEFLSAGSVSGCVLSSAIPCKTSAATFKKRLDGLTGSSIELESSLRKRVAQYEEIRARWDAAAGTDAAIEREKITKGREEERLTAARRWVEIERELATIDVGAAGDVPALREKVASAEKELTSARRLASDQAHYEKTAKRIQELRAKLDKAEKLVERLGPKGIRVDALSGALTSWLEQVNAITARLSGGRHVISVSLDPWKLTVDGRDPAMLSVSATLRVGMAVQFAIAMVTGVNLVLVDAADCLDAQNMGPFAETLSEYVEATGCQAIVTATREPGQWPTFGETYWLEAGMAASVSASDRELVGAR